MTLKPWREIAVRHEDVLRGTFAQAEFAAEISRVHAGTATPDHQNPALSFQRTVITEGMRLLLDSVVKRLSGRGGDPAQGKAVTGAVGLTRAGRQARTALNRGA